MQKSGTFEGETFKMITDITSKIFSTLGSNSSLLPLAIKDVANSAGITLGSYMTGKETEGQDRFIDEFGTEIIWLGGIPFYKKISDLTLYKLTGIDHKFDVRNITKINKLKNGTKEQIAEAEEFAKIMLEKTPEHLKESVKKALSKPILVKNLSLLKFGISTALAIATYMGLTNYRQKYRLNKEIENLKEEQAKQKNSKTLKHKQLNVPQAFEGVHKNKNHDKKGISFTGGIQEFMLNPVKNMMILDAAITEERLRSSESKQEFINYSIKEASTWAFMYFAGPVFQKYFENKVMEKKGFPINMDSRIIESTELHEAMGSGTLKQSIEEFEKKCSNATDTEIYKFIHEHPDNEIVKMAKKADIVSVVNKKKGDLRIDTRAYLDIADFKDLKDRLHKLLTSCEERLSGKNADERIQGLEDFLKEVKKAKRFAIFKNMGICVTALGVGVPLLMVASRYLIPNNREYKVREAAAKELAKQQKNGLIA